MFIIKSCPSCGRKLRFPIDRGKIKISCSCGFSFTADPDSPELYKGAEFDLNGRPAEKTSEKLSGKQKKEKIIQKLYQYRYDIQNFPLLPAKQKLKITAETLLVLICIGAAAALILYFRGFFSPADVGTYI